MFFLGIKFSSQTTSTIFSSGILFFILLCALFVTSYSNILTLDKSILKLSCVYYDFVIFIQFF